jgi:hypothetical protein
VTLEPWLVRVLAGIAGAVVCFCGYSAIRAMLGVTAFLVAAHALASHPAWLPSHPSWLAPVLVLAAGIVAAILVSVAWKVGIPLLGAVVAILLAARLSVGMPIDPVTKLVGLAIVGLVGALAARFLERVTISLATAAYGALMIVLALFFPLQRGWLPGRVAAERIVPSLPILLAWGLCAAAGAWVQLRPKGRKGKDGE